MIRGRLGLCSEASHKNTPPAAPLSLQLPVLASKPGLLALVDELTKLEPLLSQAVKEELEEARPAWEAQAAARHAAELTQREEQWRADKEQAVKAASKAGAEEGAKREPSRARMQELLREPLHKLLELLYFSQVRTAGGLPARCAGRPRSTRGRAREGAAGPLHALACRQLCSTAAPSPARPVPRTAV